MHQSQTSFVNAQIAVAGNPNCGKTTLFNGLTGLRYKVANYPGVTVESKRGKVALSGFDSLTLVDLPGIYSLSGRSLDEQIASCSLLGIPHPGNSRGNSKKASIPKETTEAPDAIVAVVDSSNLERNLYLVTQLIDLGLPVCLALNMGDLAEEHGIEVHREVLSRELDVPVVSILAKKKVGFERLMGVVSQQLSTPKPSQRRFRWMKESPVYEEEAQRLGKLYLQGGPRAENEDSARLLGSALLADSMIVPQELLLEVEQSRAILFDEGIDPYSFEATARYQWINSIVRRAVYQEAPAQGSFSERLDTVLSHRIWGTLTFLLIMATVFQSIFTWAQVPMELIDGAFSFLGASLSSLLPEGVLRSLLVDGVIAGVGNVVIFIPQIALLFFFLGLLEDSGYLARAAFLMDRVMRPFGLQGRSFIPLLSSFACAIPGILSSRTIPSWADRMATIMVAPLMSCSARLPVFAVLIAAFIPSHAVLGVVSLQGLVLLGMYLLGIIGAAFIAWLLKLSLLRGKPALFVMEMPPLRRPSLKVVTRDVGDRVLTFLKTAGTTILACSILLWVLASYPRPPEGVTTGRVQYSFAGKIGHAMEPVLKPLGFTWEVGVGILTSFAAREVFVSTLATVYNLDESGDTNTSLIETLKKKRNGGDFSLPSALSLMVFYVFACQCMSTLAVCKRETGSWGWTGFMFAYMTVLATVAAFATFHLSSMFFL